MHVYMRVVKKHTWRHSDLKLLPQWRLHNYWHTGLDTCFRMLGFACANACVLAHAAYGWCEATHEPAGHVTCRVDIVEEKLPVKRACETVRSYWYSKYD